MRTLMQILCAASLLSFASGSVEAGFIFAGNHTLLPNQANQVINILASPSAAGEIAPGLNLNFAVGDGGSVVNGTDNNAPRISSINLKPAGGLFANIPDIQTNVFSSQKLFQVTIAPTNVASRPVITANVLLAQVILDTTGLASGTFLLDLDGLPGPPPLPPSDFAGAATTISNGSVVISAVPEPGSLLCLCLVGGIGALNLFQRRLVNGW